MTFPDLTPRSVKPRQTRFRALPIVAIDIQGETLDDFGNIGCLEDFITTRLIQEDGFLLVTMDSVRVLHTIQQHYQELPSWQSKTTRKEIVRYYGTDLEKRGGSFGFPVEIPIFCGLKNSFHSHHPERESYAGRNLSSRYSYFLDPNLFYGNARTVATIFGSSETLTSLQLMHWGRAMRIFCMENDLPWKPTAGALASQFLTDRRFYPNARRKVPKATNDRMRARLPGNYSKLVVHPGTGRTWDGIYLDQRRAHHYHARTTKLPSSESLFAYGDYAHLERLSFDQSQAERLIDAGFSGYLCGDFTAPSTRVTFLPPGWRRRIKSRRFVTTAEWPYMRSLGCRCLGLFAAWGSTEGDTGISAFSRHAESTLDLWSTRRDYGNNWVKPILIATYGVLAVNVDRTTETLYGNQKPDGGLEKVSWGIGERELHGFLVRNTKGNKVEPGSTNVLHRAIIESATRTESIAYANHVQSLGYRVLMIHVDGVIIEERGERGEQSDDELRAELEIEPWRIKTKLTDIEFIDDNSFRSREMIRMPGRSGEERQGKMIAVVPPTEAMRTSRPIGELSLPQPEDYV